MMKNLLSLNNTNPYLLEFEDFQPFGNAVILIVFEIEKMFQNETC